MGVDRCQHACFAFLLVANALIALFVYYDIQRYHITDRWNAFWAGPPTCGTWALRQWTRSSNDSVEELDRLRHQEDVMSEDEWVGIDRGLTIEPCVSIAFGYHFFEAFATQTFVRRLESTFLANVTDLWWSRRIAQWDIECDAAITVDQ